MAHKPKPKKRRGQRRVAGVEGRQMTTAQAKAIVAGQVPIRAPGNVETEAPSLGLRPQAALGETNLFMQQAAAQAGTNIDPVLLNSLFLDEAEVTLASRKARERQRRVSAQEAGLRAAGGAIGGSALNRLFHGAKGLLKAAPIRSKRPKK